MRSACPLDLALPGAGRWLVQNSPADRVPSHGTFAFASAHAIDLTPVDRRGVSARITARSLLVPEAPERFAGFGRPVSAPHGGVVVRARDGQADHHAYRGLPSVTYMLTQGSRAAGGWAAVAGNHLIIAIEGDGPFVALCHLRQGSLVVGEGDTVLPGQRVARCGNSGNSTEPHVHLQAMTAQDPDTADPVPFTLSGSLPRNGTIITGD